MCVCGGRSVDMGHLMFYAQFFCDLKTALKMSIFFNGEKVSYPCDITIQPHSSEGRVVMGYRNYESYKRKLNPVRP